MKILVNYATVSGNSAMLAEQLKDKLAAKHQDKEFVYKDADECKGEDYSQYDLIIFVSSTWDDGEINMVADEYLGQLTGVEGKKFALVGLGDSSYPDFCGAVNKTQEKLQGLGVEVVGEAFKIDGFVEDEVVEQVTSWADGLIATLG